MCKLTGEINPCIFPYKRKEGLTEAAESWACVEWDISFEGSIVKPWSLTQSSSWGVWELTMRALSQLMELSTGGFVICWQCWKVGEMKRSLVVRGSSLLDSFCGRLHLVSRPLLHTLPSFCSWAARRWVASSTICCLPHYRAFLSLLQAQAMKAWGQTDTPGTVGQGKAPISTAFLSPFTMVTECIWLMQNLWKANSLSLAGLCAARTSVMGMAVVSSHLLEHGGTYL